MSSANASPGGPRPAEPVRSPRSGESHTRMTRSPTPAAPPARHHGWARCEDAPPAEPPPAARAAAPALGEEPRTGVVRRMDPRAGARRPAPVHGQAPSEGRAVGPASEPRDGSPSGWACLEAWRQPARERRPRRNAKVTIAQLSRSGDLVRQNGPDAWLPEAGDFMQRMSRLLAQGLGYERCRSLCLKGSSAALTVTEAGESKVVAVTGPLRSMVNVLRRAGLE